MISSCALVIVLVISMFAPLRSHIPFRATMFLLALALAGFSLWIALAELSRSGVRQLPTSSDAAAIAITARTRAAWAAAFGGVRGDLWAESAFTYATLLSPSSAQDVDLSTIASQAHTVVERALARAPYDADLWLLAARLALRFNWPRANPVSTLKMSYYTGPNELHLILESPVQLANSQVLHLSTPRGALHRCRQWLGRAQGSN
jgi:hypothetical protein